jgi:hypothetical protein
VFIKCPLIFAAGCSFISQEILGHPYLKVHYFDKTKLSSILSWINRVRVYPKLLEIRLNIILPSIRTSLEWFSPYYYRPGIVHVLLISLIRTADDMISLYSS